MSRRGLYIHVPLCRGKCLYCDFYSLAIDDTRVAQYMEALLKEIGIKGAMWGGPIDTIYFGGGTPSCLSVDKVAAILKECGRFFTWERACEVTFELNPGTTDGRYLKELHALGVTRVSVGLQTKEPHHLARLGRSHTGDDFFRLMENLRVAGFCNYSVDAMYGLPRQTLYEHLDTLRTIVAAGAPHVSVYALQVEPFTPLADLVAQGEVALPTDDLVADMMLAGGEYLEAQGFLHYEFSNFARANCQSQHNIIYWHNEEYIGLGPSAASYIGGRRSVNVPDITQYALSLNAGRLPVQTCELLTGEKAMSETIILGLRLLDEGVNRGRFSRRFGRDCVEVYSSVMAKLVGQGLLEVTEEAVRLTARAFPLANQILIKFLS